MGEKYKSSRPVHQRASYVTFELGLGRQVEVSLEEIGRKACKGQHRKV
jgi:hypothetical protein